MKTDYPEFRNKRIKISGIQCLVVDCSYYAGITVVQEDDKDNFVICITRKEFKDHLATYKRLFYLIVKMVKMDTRTPVYMRDFFKCCGNARFVGEIDNTKCAFQ